MNSRLVWDDDHRGPPPKAAAPQHMPPAGDGVVRIQRRIGGRGGKTVTAIEGLGMAPPQLEDLARELKKRLGCGGAVEGLVVVLQGDLREQIEAILGAKGYVVKRAGG